MAIPIDDSNTSFLIKLFGGIATGMMTVGSLALGAVWGYSRSNKVELGARLDAVAQNDKQDRDRIWEEIHSATNKWDRLFRERDGELTRSAVELERRLGTFPNRDDLAELRDEMKEDLRTIMAEHERRISERFADMLANRGPVRT